MIEQLAWDFDDLLEPIEKPGYTGRAPLHFTVEVFTLEDFEEAWEAYIAANGHMNCIAESHMWHASYTSSSDGTPGHFMKVLTAELGWHTVNRAVCQCEWASAISLHDAESVAEWHDHAWPGWRALPVVPKEVRPRGGGINKTTKPALSWVEARYPVEWQKPGAPVITERDGIGNRHVPGYSPWGGYDLSSTALEWNPPGSAEWACIPSRGDIHRVGACGHCDYCGKPTFTEIMAELAHLCKGHEVAA